MFVDSDDYLLPNSVRLFFLFFSSSKLLVLLSEIFEFELLFSNLLLLLFELLFFSLLLS